METEEIKDPIGEVLNIEPLEQVKVNEIIRAEDIGTSVEQDFESARSNIHDMIETASTAITDLSIIAKQSQHPRAFEVLAKLIETSVKANKDLLDIQEKMKQIKQMDDGSPQSINSKTVTNNLFVGSTSELQKLIKEMKDAK